MRSLVYAIAAWALAALSVVHMAVTPKYYARHGDPAIWFFAGGVLIGLIAAVNLLNRAYGRVAPGLRAVAFISNVVLLGTFVAGGLLVRPTFTQWVLVLVIMGPLCVLAPMKRALR